MTGTSTAAASSAMTGRFGTIAIGEEHAVLKREQAKKLRHRLSSNHDREGAEKHRRESQREIDPRKWDLDRVEERIGDEVG
jgi:hypothetical protein